MKITPKSADPVKIARADTPDVRLQTPASAAAESTESVHLSSLSTKLAARASARDAPMNVDHVERIKTAIKNGEFSINAGVVADKLLEIERDNLSA